MRPRIDRAVPKVPERPREGMSGTHLRMLTKLACIVCGRKADHAHHLMRGLPVNERGTSRRAADRWAIPLCVADHNSAHAGGDDEAFLISKGVDGRTIADALWRERGDEDAMRRIIERSLLGRRRYEEVG